MNCHGENKNGHGSHKHSPLKHMLHMVICCGLPLLIVGVLPLIAKVSPGAAGVIGRITPFLCPLMMVAMIPMMLGGREKEKGNCCDNQKDENSSTKALNQPVD